jgi:hypothetical protein
MNTIKRLLITAVVLMTGMFSLLPSCKKTEYEQEKKPYKQIETFSLKSYAGDTINAVINEGNIVVYWAAETTLPATIRPVIVVSPDATISPASGAEVAFNVNTVYTVTAEDGTTQTYRLKPVINYPVPKISSINPANLHFISGTTVTISGEYFLAGTAADVRVYAQRLKDGFEFDLPIDPTKLTMTNITANLPTYTPLLDTGAHKVWVKIGNRVSDTKAVTIRIPDISYTDLLKVSFKDAGVAVAAGDSITMRIADEHNGNVVKWYAKKFSKLVIENYSFEAPALTQTDSTIKFKLPDYPVDRAPNSFVLYFKDGYGNAVYLSRIIGVNAFPKMPVK